MCGIAGYVDLEGKRRVDARILVAMTEELFHRGPDSSGCFVDPDVGMGIRRLKIIDLETGDQPIKNEDGSVVVVCNGEIFNYRDLRRELRDRGHVFRTQGDVEVLVHLYEERGVGLLERLNGQFAFAIYDLRQRQLLLARDHFGVNPLYFSITGGLLLFASEIKSILRHPAAPRRVDLAGLDQVLSLPGVVSPRTMFQGIQSLKSGHCAVVAGGSVSIREYWDLDYPEAEGVPERPKQEYVEDLRDLFRASVRRRLQADVPVGLFVSGGLDSSMVAAVAKQVSPSVARHSFSVTFEDAEIDETKYQRLMSRAIGSLHHEIRIDAEEIAARLREMVFHCESPVKETFNTCALALSEAAREAGITVVLAGEGADELFGGYPGYRFDAFGVRGNGRAPSVEEILEEELRERVWGDRSLFYEKEHVAFNEAKLALYSPAVRCMAVNIDCMNHQLVNKDRLRNRHIFHQRSYLDFKLRLADHLLSEHGDRMVMANSVEARYPFLDIDLVEFASRIPPRLKLKEFTEKYVVKRMAEGVIARAIIEREKFGFRAPGSPLLLQRRVEWVRDLLSCDYIRRRGFFDTEVVERLKQRYSTHGFRLHPHLETDMLMVVLTFNLLCELFDLPGLN